MTIRMESDASLLKARQSLYFYNPVSVVTWNEAGWTKGIINQVPFLENSFPVVGAHTIARAWAYISLSDSETVSPPYLIKQFNISSVSAFGVNIRVFFDIDMTDADYVVSVLGTWMGWNFTPLTYATYNHNLGYFDVLGYENDGIVSQYNLAQSNFDHDQKFGVLVFGGPG